MYSKSLYILSNKIIFWHVPRYTGEEETCSNNQKQFQRQPNIAGKTYFSSHYPCNFSILYFILHI